MLRHILNTNLFNVFLQTARAVYKKNIKQISIQELIDRTLFSILRSLDSWILELQKTRLEILEKLTAA